MLNADGTIVSAAYNNSRHRFTDRDLNGITAPNKTLIIGDLNARHSTWHNKRNNVNGNFLLDYVLRKNIAICCPDTPTHYPSNNATPSFIDIFLNKNIPFPIVPTSLPSLSSDHNPVIFTIPTNNHTVTHNPTYNYKRTNWQAFRRIINNSLTINNTIRTAEDIDTEIIKLTRAVLNARDKTTPLIIIKPRQENIPEDIINLIKFKNKIRKQWQKYRRPLDKTRMTDLQHNITQKLIDFKNDIWQDTLKRLSVQDNSLWRLAKNLRKPFLTVPTLYDNNTPKYTDLDKANLIASKLHQIQTAPPTPSPNTTPLPKTPKLSQHLPLSPLISINILLPAPQNFSL